MSFKKRSLIFLVIAMIGLAPCLMAQKGASRLEGIVKDSTGGVVPGATVTLTNIDTGVAAVAVSRRAAAGIDQAQEHELILDVGLDRTAVAAVIALLLGVCPKFGAVILSIPNPVLGGVTLAQFQAQAAGVAIPSQLLAMLPYVATIVVLALISRDATAIRLNAPASLGKPFHPD